MTEKVFPPAINGVEQRLDAVLDELRGLRMLLTPPEPVEIPSETIELREPSKKKSAKWAEDV